MEDIISFTRCILGNQVGLKQHKLQRGDIFHFLSFVTGACFYENNNVTLSLQLGLKQHNQHSYQVSVLSI